MSTSIHLTWRRKEDGEEQLTLNSGHDYADCLLWQGGADEPHVGVRCRTKAEARALVAYFERLFDTYAATRREGIANAVFHEYCDEDGDFLSVRDETAKIRWRVPQDQADRRELLHILRLWGQWVRHHTELPVGEEATK